MEDLFLDAALLGALVFCFEFLGGGAKAAFGAGVRMTEGETPDRGLSTTLEGADDATDDRALLLPRLSRGGVRLLGTFLRTERFLPLGLVTFGFWRRLPVGFLLREGDRLFFIQNVENIDSLKIICEVCA